MLLYQPEFCVVIVQAGYTPLAWLPSDLATSALMYNLYVFPPSSVRTLGEADQEQRGGRGGRGGGGGDEDAKSWVEKMRRMTEEKKLAEKKVCDCLVVSLFPCPPLLLLSWEGNVPLSFSSCIIH